MKNKQRTYLGLRPLFIKRFLRGSVKCLPYLGNLLDEIIFGVLEEESANTESEKIHNKLAEIIEARDHQEADLAEILLALHIQTDVNETIKERLREIEQSLRKCMRSRSVVAWASCPCVAGPSWPCNWSLSYERTL